MGLAQCLTPRGEIRLPNLLPPGALTAVRKRCYYALLNRNDEFSLGFANLFRHLEMLQPRTEPDLGFLLLNRRVDWTKPLDSVQWLRTTAARFDKRAAQRRAAGDQGGGGWDEERDEQLLLAEAVESIEAFRTRWCLPADAANDIVTALNICPDEPRLPDTLTPIPEVENPPIILTPPPLTFFGQESSPAVGTESGHFYLELHAGGSYSIRDARTAANSAETDAEPKWAIPYNPAPPRGETRKDLNRKLSKLFAFLRAQAVEQANAGEARLLARGFDAHSRSWENEALTRGASQLYRRVILGESYDLIAHDLNVRKQTVYTQVKAWAKDLGIPLAP